MIDMEQSSTERGEHTPGPWCVEVEAEPDEGCPASIYVCHPNTECDVTVVATMGRAWSVAEQRKMADARLIAAAPELLALLEAFVDGDSGDSIDTRYENARQAIAKAKAVQS